MKSWLPIVFIVACFHFSVSGQVAITNPDSKDFFSRKNASQLVAEQKYFFVKKYEDFREEVCADSLLRKYHFKLLPYPHFGCEPTPRWITDSIFVFNMVMLKAFDSIQGKHQFNPYEIDFLNCKKALCDMGDSLDQFLGISSVLFEYKSAYLRSQVKCFLFYSLLPILNEYPRLQIKFVGQSTADEMDNKNLLALERAKQVRDYLENLGIKKGRIEIEGIQFSNKEWYCSHPNSEKCLKENRKVFWTVVGFCD